jgi:hypothetical protein
VPPARLQGSVAVRGAIDGVDVTGASVPLAAEGSGIAATLPPINSWRPASA